MFRSKCELVYYFLYSPPPLIFSTTPMYYSYFDLNIWLYRWENEGYNELKGNTNRHESDE